MILLSFATLFILCSQTNHDEMYLEIQLTSDSFAERRLPTPITAHSPHALALPEGKDGKRSFLYVDSSILWGAFVQNLILSSYQESDGLCKFGDLLSVTPGTDVRVFMFCKVFGISYFCSLYSLQGHYWKLSI